MTAKEKSNELYNKFYNTSVHSHSVVVRKSITKENIITCVNEILEYTKKLHLPMRAPMDDLYDYDVYWLDVKREIERM